MQIKVSAKHVQISKSQQVIAATIATATIIAAFSLVSSKALLNQAMFQRKVLTAKNEAIEKLEKNSKAAETMMDQYNSVFEGNSPTNILGGKNTKDKNAIPPDGTNSRIVLDALPTTYDFPALLTSVAHILQINGVAGQSITGKDESSTVDDTPSSAPIPTAISLTLEGVAPSNKVQSLIKDLERSVRPFDVTKFSIGGNQSALTVELSFNTYFQPAKTLTSNKREIK